MLDLDMYHLAHPDDRWVYNKLMIAELQHLPCGPAGTLPPRPMECIVRPIMNLSGMGAGAKRMWLDPTTNLDEIPPGHFWVECIGKSHTPIYSIDYNSHGDPIRKTRYEPEWRDGAVRMVRYADVHVEADEPSFFRRTGIELTGWYTTNIEMIRDTVIEVHLRGNPNPRGEWEVVWDDDPSKNKGGSMMRYEKAYDDANGHIAVPRQGFRKVK